MTKKTRCRGCGKEFDYNNDIVNHEMVCNPFISSGFYDNDKKVNVQEMLDLMYSTDINISEKLNKYEPKTKD